MRKFNPEEWPTMNERGIERHRRERSENGMSWFDWINFDEYIAQIIVNACNRFLVDGHTFPASLNNNEEWKVILTEMRDGFQAHLDLQDGFFDKPTSDELETKYKRGMQLFAIYHRNMWD